MPANDNDQSIFNNQVVDGLAGCESLKKLDLTLNFIGEVFVHHIFVMKSHCKHKKNEIEVRPPHRAVSTPLELKLDLDRDHTLRTVTRSTTVLIINLDSRFVLKVSSVKNLVENEALEELYLTGNPCCQVPS